MIGTTISHYKIIEKIGQGGMGIVYKALDIRLNRPVAIKILPAPLSSDEKKRQRFLHEARAASALNHPNICQVHDIGRENGTDFIVMEYVEGKTLRQVIEENGKLPLDETIRIGIEICSALQAAHEKGIIHRDIKPDNIMITNREQVKVMDFGLAKLKSDMPVVERPDHSFVPDVSYFTSMSTLMGTVFYMSPEQIEKGEVDERTDIFSLGIVLYEMLTGRQPFRGSNNMEIMDAILEQQPLPPSQICPVDQATEKLILKALAKEPHKRLASAKELGEKLQELLEIQKKKEVRRGKLLTAAFIALAILLIGAPGVRFYFKARTSKPRLYPIANSAALEESPIFNPKGDKILYRYWDSSIRTGHSFLNVYDLNDKSERTLDFSGDPLDWFGSRLLFLRGDYGLVLADTAFSSEKKISDMEGMAKFSPDGNQIVLSRTRIAYIGASNQIYVYDLQTEAIAKISPDNGLFYSDPVWSPDGKKIFCVGGRGSVYELWSIDLDTRRARQLSHFGNWLTNPIVSGTDNKLYFLSDKNGGFDIWSVEMDFAKGRITGKPKQLTFGLNVNRMDVDAKGRKIVFENGETVSTISWTQLSQLNAQHLGGESLPQKYEHVESIHLSPAKDRILLEAREQGSRCIIVRSLKSDSEIVLGKGLKPFAPSWSADGKWIVFDAGGGDNADIWRIPAAGGKPEPVIEYPGADWMPTYSPDGTKLCFVSNRLNNQFDLWIKDFATGKEYSITNTPEHESRGFWSHSGKQLAYISIDKENKYAVIRIYNFENKSIHTIWNFDGQLPNSVDLLNWNKDDTGLYVIKLSLENTKILLEIPIEGGQPKVLGKFRLEEISTFDVSSDTLYFVSNREGADIWMLELE